MMRRVFFILMIISVTFSCKDDSENQSVIDEKLILEYIEKEDITAIKHESGLYYQIINEGSTNYKPNISSEVEVFYKGYFLDGRVFDETINNTPIKFPLSNLIRGWQYGIPLIGVGGKIILILPSELAYGSSGSGGVPPNTVLAFEIDLLSFR